MNNKNIISNYNYGLIIKNKYNFYNNLSNIINYCTGEFSVPLIALISLYCIDLNNVNKESYTNKEMLKVLEFLKKYENNENTIDMKKEELERILSTCKNKRVTCDINKLIVLKVAEYNNKLYGNDDIANSIDINELNKTLDEIKD